MNIILYGPPGVGKTTVGNALAGRLGREFVDSDRLIENYAGRSIPHIFSQLGEAEFRRLESKVCLELAARQNAVIGLGGPSPGLPLSSRVISSIFLQLTPPAALT